MEEADDQLTNDKKELFTVIFNEKNHDSRQWSPLKQHQKLMFDKIELLL